MKLRGFGYVDVGCLVRIYGEQVAREVLQQLVATRRRRFKRGLSEARAS